MSGVRFVLIALGSFEDPATSEDVAYVAAHVQRRSGFKTTVASTDLSNTIMAKLRLETLSPSPPDTQSHPERETWEAKDGQVADS